MIMHQNESETLLFLEECEIVMDIIELFRFKTNHQRYQFPCVYLILEIENLQEKLLRSLDNGEKKWKNTYCNVSRQLKKVEEEFQELEETFSWFKNNSIIVARSR
jgi:uncharacterized OsmC-like protein